MESLVQKIMTVGHDEPDDLALLWNLLYASVCCSGFSERQKCGLTQIAARGGVHFPPHTYAESWPFETLHRVAGVDDILVNVSSFVQFASDLISFLHCASPRVLNPFRLTIPALKLLTKSANTIRYISTTFSKAAGVTDFERDLKPCRLTIIEGDPIPWPS